MNEAYDIRAERGYEIAIGGKVTTLVPKEKWTIRSQHYGRRKGTTYTITNDSGKYRCDCLDHQRDNHNCKHIWAVHYDASLRRREENPRLERENSAREVARQKSPPMQRDWKKYREARVNQADLFPYLLADLMDNVHVYSPPRRGRTIDWRSAIYAIVMKTYEGKAADIFMSDYRYGLDQGHATTDCCSNTILNYLNREDLEKVLKDLIAVSCIPLTYAEDVLAVDSTGFTTSRKAHYSDMKWGKDKTVDVPEVVGILPPSKLRKDYIKAHMACGVRTNIVAAVEVDIVKNHDAKVFPIEFQKAADALKIKEVVADKAYSSSHVFDLVTAHGMRAYIEHKTNTRGVAVSNAFRESLHFFRNNQEEFYQHYNKRSNVESMFSSLKRTFDVLRSRNVQAMKNEVLCKVLCHNINSLIHAHYALEGVEVPALTRILGRIVH